MKTLEVNTLTGAAYEHLATTAADLVARKWPGCQVEACPLAPFSVVVSVSPRQAYLVKQTIAAQTVRGLLYDTYLDGVLLVELP